MIVVRCCAERTEKLCGSAVLVNEVYYYNNMKDVGKMRCGASLCSVDRTRAASVSIPELKENQKSFKYHGSLCPFGLNG